jgi:hypothetical protein
VTEEKDAIHLHLTLSRKGAQSFVCLFVTHQPFKGTFRPYHTRHKGWKVSNHPKTASQNVTIFRHQTLLIISTLDYPKIISNLFLKYITNNLNYVTNNFYEK